MKKIIFLRTAPYQYLLKGIDLYDSFDAVATRKVDISIDGKGDDSVFPKTIKYISQVFCSPVKRSIETAGLISKNPIVLSELYEVYYSMQDFIGKNDFYSGEKPDVKKARKAFVNALINNRLEESYKKVIERVEFVLETLSIQQEDCIVFSHGFFLKILEVYTRDKAIKSDPQKLLKYFSGETETFHFLEGFILESSNKGYSFEEYIRNGEGA